MARRWILPLTSLAALGVAFWWWRRRSMDDASQADAFVPVQPADIEPAGVAWVAPVDGTCPPGYPVKVNETSGIIHVPGGRFYDRTVPHRCYASAEDAEADGYRRAKA